MATLIPNRFLFSFEIALTYRAKFPKLDGSLKGWSDVAPLPSLASLEGKHDFAPVWVCWNETGLAIGCQVENKRTPLRCDPANYWKGDNLRVCIDTRPSSENKRATRFCRQFYFLPAGGTDGKSPVAGVGKFQRAREEAPPTRTELIRVASRVTASGYSLEAIVPAECLPSFDPIEHPRLGFYYILEDSDHGQQYLTVGDDLLWYADPSTWAMAVLSRQNSVDSAPP